VIILIATLGVTIYSQNANGIGTGLVAGASSRTHIGLLRDCDFNNGKCTDDIHCCENSRCKDGECEVVFE